MKIGIDATAIDLPFSNGVKTYTQNLITNLSHIDKVNKYYIFSRGGKKMVINKNFCFVRLPSFPFFKRQIVIPLYAKLYKLDVMHFLEPYGAVFPFNFKIVTTVQDFDLEKIYNKNHLFDFKIQIKKALRCLAINNSDSIITSTDSVKSELVNQFGYDKNKIRKIYFGINNIFTKLGKTNNKNNFILTMADFSPRKNIKNTILAYSALPNIIKLKYKLYIVVSTKRVAKEIEKIVFEFGDRWNVVIFSEISDQKLAQMYRGASLFLYPSLYEGFGLPVLEAMRCGCPVVTSNYGATKEISNNAAYLIDPKSVTVLKEAIQKIVLNKGLSKRLIKAGLIRSVGFSWKKCARQTLSLYKEVYAT